MSLFAKLSVRRHVEPDPSLDQGDSGGALLEFTILAPLFFLILFATIEFGSIFYLRNNMVNAAREAARTWAVQQPGTMTAQQACNIAQQYLAGNGQTFACVATDHCNSAPKAQDVTVQVSVDAAAASLTNYLGVFTGGTLTASVTMRKEIACP